MARITALLAMGLILTGCVRSLQPIIKPEQAVKIEGIEGKWVSADDDKQCVLEIAAAGDGYSILYTEKDNEPGTFNMLLGRMGDMLIADVMPADMPKTTPGQVALTIPVHMALHVTRTSPQLAVKGLKSDWFRENVAAHPDEIATVKSDDDPIITASTEQIQAFLIRHAHDEDAWSDERVFARAPAADNRPTTQRTATGK